MYTGKSIYTEIEFSCAVDKEELRRIPPTDKRDEVRRTILMKDIRRRTRVVGAFLDGNSAFMLVCPRLRYVAGIQWGGKKHMKHLEAMVLESLAR